MVIKMIVFVGALYLEDQTEWFQNHAKIPIAISSDTHQKAIISGLSEHEEVFILNRPSCGYFPKKFSKIMIKAQKGPNYISMGWINLLIIRDIQYVFSTAVNLWKLCRTQDVQAIVGYMPFLVRILPLVINKLFFPKISLSIIVPDLPQHSYPKDRFMKIMKAIRGLEGKIVNALSKHVDSYVYISEQMHDILGKNCNYIVQETIFEPIEQQLPQTAFVNEMKGFFTCVYCGKINRGNGLDRLVEAFMKLEYSDVRLIICGDGELLDTLKEMTAHDARVLLTGQLNLETIISIEQHATVLINPRYTGQENTGYSFPGKLIEYLSIGRPVISSKLEGIPRDYDPHLFYLADNSVEAVETALRDVYEMDGATLDEFGKEGKLFVENNKTAKIQGEKFYSHLLEIRNSLKGLLDGRNGK